MISTLKGTLAEKWPEAVVIDCGGIGYYVKIPQSISGLLPEVGQETQLLTAMIFSKNDISMVGFLDEQQRTCFQHLTGVSGCGVKNGLAILGALTPGQLYRAIAENDATAISKVKGVGKKLSLRIVLELKEKIKTLAQEELPISTENSKATMVKSDSAQMAVSALISLGFKRKEAENAVAKVDPMQTVEQIISTALRKHLV